ncbi:hypothetical protein F2Q68_00016773 [Brassica cretica]|uniref:Uncharacterized protein n=1 Tax=Brassica cretica TaxID=69181 RepID=A0A8S9HUF7_BRACR|nr:hypothetical protein F2Q68_00016773 [Brassica cretica]
MYITPPTVVADDHLDELGPTFDEKALSITPIIMENRLFFDPGTTPTPLSKEHCKELCIISFVPDMFDKVSSNDIKRSGLDHLEKSFELDLQQLVYCSRKSFDSFVFKENSFSLRSYGHKLITGILFASSYALDDFMVSTLLEQNSHKAETDFCDSVLKLKRVLHVLGKETLISYLNKYMSCTYDPGILVSVLSVQDKQVQSQRSVRNKSIDHTYQPKIWRWKYLRKTTGQEPNSHLD